MHSMQRRWRSAVAVLVCSLACTMVAFAQSAKAVPELKSIAGKWSGTGHSPQGTNRLEWDVKEDGTVEVSVGTPSGPRTGWAKLSIKDGKLFYESGTSSGPVTIEESGGRRVLRYDAVFKRDSARGGAELTQVR
jgi:hypothetical protein